MSEQHTTAYPPSIIAALHEVMAAVPYVQKTGRNQHFNFSYASEADVLAALRPAMLDAGLVIIPSVAGDPHIEEFQGKQGSNYRATVTIEYTLAHKDGSVWPEKLRWEGCGVDTQDKMISKAITSGQKYFLLKLFQIETGNDPDKDEREELGKRTAGQQQQQRQARQGQGQRRQPPPQQAAGGEPPPELPSPPYDELPDDIQGEIDRAGQADEQDNPVWAAYLALNEAFHTLPRDAHALFHTYRQYRKAWADAASRDQQDMLLRLTEWFWGHAETAFFPQPTIKATKGAA